MQVTRSFFVLGAALLACVLLHAALGGSPWAAFSRAVPAQGLSRLADTQPRRLQGAQTYEYVGCFSGNSMSRPYGDKPSTIDGVQSCRDACAAGGYEYFGAECPHADGAEFHCECGNGAGALGGTSLPSEKCSQFNTRSGAHCKGPFEVSGTIGTYKLGAGSIGSVYKTAPTACTELSTLAENNFNNRGSTTLNPSSTYNYRTSCGYVVKLTGWTHTRTYAKGFLRNKPGVGKAVVEGLMAGHVYEYKIYQFASHYAGRNLYLVNGVSKGRTTSSASVAATATGQVEADRNGKVTFTFVRQSHHVHLSAIAIAEATHYKMIKSGNCLTHGLAFIKTKGECIAAGKQVGIVRTENPSPSGNRQKYCGTWEGNRYLHFNSQASGYIGRYPILQNAGRDLAGPSPTWQICKAPAATPAPVPVRWVAHASKNCFVNHGARHVNFAGANHGKDCSKDNLSVSACQKLCTDTAGCTAVVRFYNFCCLRAHVDIGKCQTSGPYTTYIQG